MSHGVDAGDPQAERGVAPVIAVLLMAAVALVLAAVVAFVLSLGEETEESAPVVATELDRGTVDSNVEGNERVSILHESGDTVPISELRIITEAQCFDETTLTSTTERGELVNLPADFGGIDDENIEGAEIFETAPQAGEAPLAGDDEAWRSGERLLFQIADDECSIQSSSRITVEVIHEPSNSRITSESLGTGFTPAALENEADPPTPDEESTHSWGLDDDNINNFDPDGEDVDTITVDYDPNGGQNVGSPFDGLNETDVTVTMTRTLSDGTDRDKISVNNDEYEGSTATFDLSGIFDTDVAGPIEIEIDGIENPSEAGEYDVAFTLDGDEVSETFTETVEIEGE